MADYELSLADVLRSPLVSPAELREIERDAAAIGRHDIGRLARAELGRRADELGKAPLFLRVAAAVRRELRR